MLKRLQSGFLFAQPSFASGMASSIDLWGQSQDYNDSESVAQADANAIFGDWAIVGQDIEDALELAHAGEV